MAANNLPILEFVLKNYKNFNSRATRDASHGARSGAVARGIRRAARRRAARATDGRRAARAPTPNVRIVARGCARKQ